MIELDVTIRVSVIIGTLFGGLIGVVAGQTYGEIKQSNAYWFCAGAIGGFLTIITIPHIDEVDAFLLVIFFIVMSSTLPYIILILKNKLTKYLEKLL